MPRNIYAVVLRKDVPGGETAIAKALRVGMM